MKSPVIQLELIAQYALEHQAEWKKFREDISQIPVGKVDELFQPIVKEVTSNIDCTACGNCCRYQEPGVDNEEISRLAKLNDMDEVTFRKQFIKAEGHEVQYLCSNPCMFLAGNKCSIYADRPLSCADFPGLHRPGLKWRMNQMEENYSHCPIVFNVVEEVKKMIG